MRRDRARARRAPSRGGAGPIAATDDVCTTRCDAGPQRLLEHHARALGVDAPGLGRVDAQVRRARDVEDALDAAQRVAQRAAVGDVGQVDALDVEALQRLGFGDAARTVTRTSSPRSTSARATCEPTNPVAPVTSGTRAHLGARSRARIGSASCPGSPSSPTRRSTCRARSSSATGCTSCRSTSTGTGAPTARPTCRTSTRFYDYLRSAARAAEHVAAVGRATSSPSTSRCSSAGDDIALDPPVRRHLRHGAARPSRRATR